MAHRTFGAVRTAATKEPITFDFGLYSEETFTVVPEPSLGDTFDLYDAPEPLPENEAVAIRVLARFIRRMLPPEDRVRFDQALYRIPITEAHIIMDVATYITEQATGFPTMPPTTSSRGRQPTGKTSKPRTAGNKR